MPGSVITVAELETICRQAAAMPPAAPGDFQPTTQQIYFFTLVWLLKKKVLFGRTEDHLDGQIVADLTDHAHTVAQHLAEWGATIAGLKQREAKEWELLRIQMEKAISYYHCQSEELKADALQEALLKVFSLLSKMVAGRKLDETEDIVGLVVNTRLNLTNIYDFSSPFYAFAKVIARNELMTQLRKEDRHPIYPIPFDDMTTALPTVPPPSFLEDEDAIRKAQLWQLKLDLTRLLELIRHHLTPKPHRVVCQTLVGQPQFWLALTMTGLSVPDEFPPRSEFTTDLEIATTLGMTENSIRVHRVHAKKQVQAIDPLLELLFDTLLTRRDKNGIVVRI